jgi:ABC-type sugar transport system ATPase subunit
MAKLELRGVTLYERDLSNDPSARRSGRKVLDEVSLSVDSGKILGILGPTGCGKTALLRTIAGILAPAEGGVFLDGMDLAGRKPGERGLSMVFQDYALYPNLSGKENIGFRLFLGKKDPAVNPGARVAEIAQMLGVAEESILARKPKTLSLGEKQRVAIGKAIAALPALVLFDEPLSNIEERFRHELRHSLRRLLRENGATAVYVSHNQTEIAEVADEIAVMNEGRIEQVDTYARLYENPATFFVSLFVGERTTNFLKPEQAEKLLGRKALATVRPEECALSEIPGAAVIEGKTALVENFFQDREKIVFVELEGELFGAVAPIGHPAAKGDLVKIFVPRERVKWFEPEGKSPARLRE